jgi:hypothetical protein
MKNRTIALITGTLMVGLLSTSCEKKYEDDDTIELTSRAERVANTWKFGYAEDDGENVSEDFEQYELFMNTAGDAQLDASFTLFGTDYETSTNGTWSFRNNDNELVLDFEDDDQDAEYEILRLNNDELWLKNMDSNVEIHLLEK